ADPDADREGRNREPHHGPRAWRRRLRAETVRAARALAAHRQHPQAHHSGARARDRDRALRRFRVSSRARRTQARRGGGPPHRPRARHAARARCGSGRNSAAHGPCRQWRRRQRAPRRRAGQPPAPQDRARSGKPAVRPDRARHRLPAGGRAMTAPTPSLATLRSAAGLVSSSYDWFTRWLKGMMPTGLYGRALLIIITPMVVLQSVVAFVFMERHWNTVTRRLSAAVTQDISALIDVYRAYPQDPERLTIRRIALERLSLAVDFLPVSELPPPGPKPFFSLLDQALSQQISQQIRRPFWIDTVGRSNGVEIRLRLDDTVMRVFAQRSAAYASNSEIFLWWMIGTSLVLLFVAILFLRNQIKPILRLPADARTPGDRRAAPGCGGKLRQGARRARLQAARRARGAPRSASLHRDETPRRAHDRAAHHH